MATTYISPIQTLPDVERKIDSYSGKVIFDLTIINGMNSNRYIEADVYNGLFNRKSFRSVKNIEKSIKEASSKFFSDNKNVVDNGTIPMALKSLVVAG